VQGVREPPLPSTSSQGIDRTLSSRVVLVTLAHVRRVLRTVGIGKSAVLAAASEARRDRGWTVLAASPESSSEVSRWYVGCSSRRGWVSTGRSSKRSPAARRAGAPVLLPSTGPDEPRATDLAALTHGLHWLAANPSERGLRAQESSRSRSPSR
jgi:hypothetical protein